MGRSKVLLGEEIDQVFGSCLLISIRRRLEPSITDWKGFR